MYIKECVKINVIYVSVYACVASNGRLVGHKYFSQLCQCDNLLLIRVTSLSHGSITYPIILLYSNQNVKKGSETFLCPTFIAKFSLYRSLSYIQNPVVRLNWYSGGCLQPAVLLNYGHEYESLKLISLQIPIITHM